MTNEINLYSKEQTDALLDEKEDTGTAYTKAQTDALLAEKEDVGAAYTKAQTDALLAEKEDVGLSYTKAQVDGLLADKAAYGEVVELGGASDIGTDLRPIKIVGDTAVAVTNPLIDTKTEQTIDAKKTFAVNPKAAAPASGAVDTSVVNANWISQSGDSAPNNVAHRNGNETWTNEKVFTANNTRKKVNYDPTYRPPSYVGNYPAIINDKNDNPIIRHRIDMLKTSSGVGWQIYLSNNAGVRKSVTLVVSVNHATGNCYLSLNTTTGQGVNLATWNDPDLIDEVEP